MGTPNYCIKFRASIPCPHFPLPTHPGCRYRYTDVTQGRRGLLTLRRIGLSPTTFRQSMAHPKNIIRYHNSMNTGTETIGTALNLHTTVPLRFTIRDLYLGHLRVKAFRAIRKMMVPFSKKREHTDSREYQIRDTANLWRSDMLLIRGRGDLLKDMDVHFFQSKVRESRMNLKLSYNINMKILLLTYYIT